MHHTRLTFTSLFSSKVFLAVSIVLIYCRGIVKESWNMVVEAKATDRSDHVQGHVGTKIASTFCFAANLVYIELEVPSDL